MAVIVAFASGVAGASVTTCLQHSLHAWNSHIFWQGPRTEDAVYGMSGTSLPIYVLPSCIFDADYCRLEGRVVPNMTVAVVQTRAHVLAVGMLWANLVVPFARHDLSLAVEARHTTGAVAKVGACEESHHACQLEQVQTLTCGEKLNARLTDAIEAGPAVETRKFLAVVDVSPAVMAGEPFRAFALK